MPVNSICNNCQESFSTILQLEVHTETKHPDHYAIALNTKIHIKVNNLVKVHLHELDELKLKSD